MSPTGAAATYTFQAATTPAQALPTVTGLSKHSGPRAGGRQITISGSGFTAATQVFFGVKAAASVTVVSATELRVRTPAHKRGHVHVRVTTSAGSSVTGTADRYRYTGRPAGSRGASL